MIAICPYCNQNTAGEHEGNCPLKETWKGVKVDTINTVQGWRCPRCGSVWAPWVKECEACRDSNLLFISSGTTNPYPGTTYSKRVDICP